VLNLGTHNDALILKNLHKFFNKEDILGCIWFGKNIIPMVSSPFTLDPI
jgi:hypothetical protein